MTEQAKPTPGPVEISSYLHGLYKAEIVADGGRKVVATVTVKDVPVHRDLPPPDNLEGWANAHLIADAFNVHHEIGLTPRQLAEQRAELLEAVGGFLNTMADGPDDSDVARVVHRLRQSYAKARGGPDAL